MNITKQNIDGGNAFDFGKTAADYARFRDIYPSAFYEAILSRGFCTKGQSVLDLGTGTGVLPRNLYAFGASWCGTDIAPEQIEQAKRLAAENDMQIDFRTASAEDTCYPDAAFDVVTACQCFWYFDPARAYPNIARMLKPDGTLLLLYMAWLPFADDLAGQSEQLVMQYNPAWTGCGETVHPIHIPAEALQYFTLAEHCEFELPVHFTREGWHGRMRACRGVGASLLPEQLAQWDAAHRALLERIAPEEFDVRHFAAIAVLRRKPS